MRFFDISLKSYLFSQFCPKLAEILTRLSLDDVEENYGDFFENFDFLRFCAIFSTKNPKISHFLVTN